MKFEDVFDFEDEFEEIEDEPEMPPEELRRSKGKPEHCPEFEGRTFGEILPKLRERTGWIKIGCKKPGFFYIGNIENLKEPMIDIFDTELEKLCRERIETFKRKLKASIASIPTISKYIAYMYSKDGSFGDFDSYVEYVKNEWLKLPPIKAEIDKRIEDYNNRIPIRDRMVLEATKGIDPEFADEGEILLVLEGKESGGYWLLSEYERDHKPVRRGRTRRGEGKVILE